ncbi:P-type calcium ATPase [Cordyceps fumosorosea ARSEF 2679]|uniref:Calcium-transporting ATPase n=1 Tax=Cordyceps fumosorosea (strain ARSEF 2679) TaxID=1081104 RepID=A0A168E5E1_CORFA|nr:P-type calcium ATPase [Cordyceps fumosorosea ARSEF 2679]OAA73397.1 P-type calcium ATPase [Cordyceps fumosorosea ARSEF 2679]
MDEITPVPGPASTREPVASVPATTPTNNPDDAAAAAPASSEDIARDILDSEPAPEGSPFAFSTTQLYKLLTYRSLAALDVFGGLYGLAGGLRANVQTGLSADETKLPGKISFEEAVAAAREERDPVLQQVLPPRSTPTGLTLRLGDEPDTHFLDRRLVYGANRLPRRPQKSFFRLMWIAFNDKLLILLTISACISLAIGIYQSVDAKTKNANIEWVDGVTVVIAILVIIFASAATDWQKNHKFEKLNERKSQRDVAVMRCGRIQQVSVYDVMVGDILHIEAGEVLAADGVLVRAAGLHVDESSVSGETGLVHKTVANDHDPAHATRADPFLFSGTTVCRGVGQYLVTAVGANSTYGRTLISLREDVEETPLQAKLGRLGKQLILFGAAAGSVFFLILFIRFMANLDQLNGFGPSEKAERFFGILILAITVVIITVPEGLALNVTIALAFATKRMLKDNNLVRLIRSCEIMGNATTVCSDKTGTLTQNKMTVVAGRIGLECSFDDTDPKDAVAGPTAPGTIVRGDTSSYATSHLSTQIRDLLKDSIALNSTAFETDDSAKPSYVGSSTETALLKFSHDHLGMGPLREERANSPVLTMFPFDSTRKWMAVLIKLPNGHYRLLIKGAAEVVFEYCAYTIPDPEDPHNMDRLSEENRASIRESIQEYAGQMLRPVALAFRDFEASEVFENPDEDPAAVNLEWLASGLVHIGVFGIRDPLRPEVVDSVKRCQDAGVFVRMITGDNFATAKAVATECGIYTSGGIAMDGPTFRRLSPEQLDSVIPRLQVLARSSPEDKLLLVSRLRGMNETVAVTGDGTNDALALKAADVGFAMGIQGTEVAKEAASIILLDDNFASIVKALSWGRTVNDAVKKFCQFQFTINITAGIITVISELVGDSIFTVVQLLWINLIMDIFASLGLATDHPSPDFLKRKPEPRNAPIVSITMWKMILGQSIYQLLVVFLVHYIGWDIFNPGTKNEVEKLQTLVFNIYVWMQFFNQHNCRRVDNKLDIWYQGVLRNPWFIGVQCLTLAGQFIIIFKGGEAFDTEPLSGAQWGWSMLFGILTIPLGALIRQVPDRWVLRFFLDVKSAFLTVTGPVRRCLPRLRRNKKQQKQDEEQAAKHPEPLNAVEEMVSRRGRQLLQQLKGEGEDLEMTAEQRHALEVAAQRARDDGAEQEDKLEREVDLLGLIEAAKVGRALKRDVLEIHPRTPKEDPILGTWINHRVPPSQDENILRYINAGRDEDAAQRQHRRNRVPARHRWVEQTRPQQLTHTRPKARNGFTWESFLRSKRR